MNTGLPARYGPPVDAVAGRWVRWGRALLRAHPAATDAATALAVAAAALVSAYASSAAAGARHAPIPTIVAMSAITLPLAWRRRYPLSCAAAVVVAFLAGTAVGVTESPVTVLAGSLALYSAAAHGHRRRRTLVLSLALAAILAVVALELSLALPGQPLVQTFVLAFNAVVLALPWGLGTAMRSLRERQLELAERAAQLHRERETNARQAVFTERVRIARELHDVVAHHVSVMGVQAGAARRVMDRWPDKAAESLLSIEASSRQAVSELHRLLGFLRRPEEPDHADHPTGQPDLAHLADLTDRLADSGLTVNLAVEGEPRPLPPLLEVSAYRIVQEALTNTLKHSGATTATVRLRYQPTALEIEVLDDGTTTRADSARPSPASPGGHGLIGMRERANLHGGQLQAGPRPHGGFAVHATLALTGGPHP